MEIDEVLLAMTADFFKIRSAEVSTDFLTLAFSRIASTTKSTSFFCRVYISLVKVKFALDLLASS